MRTETTTRDLYTFDELTDAAKERARNWYREASAGDDFWSEYVVEDFREIAKLCGVRISGRNPNNRSGNGLYWCVGDRGEHASFAGTWYQSDMNEMKLKEHAPLDKRLHDIATALAAVPAEDEGAGLPSASISVSHRNDCMHVDTDNTTDDGREAATEALRDLADWLLCALRTEHEHQQSNECVEENITANEYEFTEDGARA